jgi:hypothetical protein
MSQEVYLNLSWGGIGTTLSHGSTFNILKIVKFVLKTIPAVSKHV